jgi:RNA polymerase sigma-70 factor (ECF subfamily)
MRSSRSVSTDGTGTTFEKKGLAERKMARKERANQGKTDRMNEVLIADHAHADQSERSLLIEPYRHELLLHCYRLLGSLHDAEDAVQDTMLRAWRHFDTFTEKGPGSLRRWLYTIATNTSLDTLKKRSPRTLPTVASTAWDPLLPVAPRSAETLWLEPFPDSWLAEATENLEARYTRYESVSLAFLTILQLLPPRQRAILLLSDVLSFRADEIAHLLESSVSAVNSALHRARVTLEKNYQREQPERVQFGHTNVAIDTLLTRYLQAWETDDVDGLVALLKEDATLSMPPVPSWYQGRDAIRRVLSAVLFPPGVQKQWRLSPTHANGQPAFVVYRADEATQSYRAFAIQVLTLDGSQFPKQVASLTAFLGPELVTSFGFPLQLPQ